MTTRHRLSAAALDRLAQVVGEDGGVTAAQIERVLSESAEQIDRVLSDARTVAMSDDDPDETYAQAALAAMGIVEDANEARMYASMRATDAAYLRGYASDLGLRPDECVTVEIEIER